MLEIGMRYSWDIRGVFTEYSWNIRMYRVCVGYVSGMCRECIGTNRVRVGSSMGYLKGIEAPARCAHEI